MKSSFKNILQILLLRWFIIVMCMNIFQKSLTWRRIIVRSFMSANDQLGVSESYNNQDTLIHVAKSMRWWMLICNKRCLLYSLSLFYCNILKLKGMKNTPCCKRDFIINSRYSFRSGINDSEKMLNQHCLIQ